MIDIDSVAKGLAACKETLVSCSACPYKSYRDDVMGRYCVGKLMEDALEAIRCLQGEQIQRMEGALEAIKVLNGNEE